MDAGDPQSISPRRTFFRGCGSRDLEQACRRYRQPQECAGQLEQAEVVAGLLVPPDQERPALPERRQRALKDPATLPQSCFCAAGVSVQEIQVTPLSAPSEQNATGV